MEIALFIEFSWLFTTGGGRRRPVDGAWGGSFLVFLRVSGWAGSPREPGEGRGGGCPKPYTRPGTSLSSSFCVFSAQPGSQPPCLGSPGRPGKPREPEAAWPAWGGPGCRERAGGGEDRPSAGPWIRTPFLLQKLHYLSSFHGFLPPREPPLPRTP